MKTAVSRKSRILWRNLPCAYAALQKRSGPDPKSVDVHSASRYSGRGCIAVLLAVPCGITHPLNIDEPEKIMLILTTNALTGEGAALAVAPWNGPRVLVVLPGSGFSRATLRSLPDDVIIIEHLQPVSGAVALLVDVMHWLSSFVDEADGPLLYLDRPADSGFLAEQADLGRRCAHEVASELTNSGRLVMLRLGDMVATSPLLPAFFTFVGNRSIDDATLADLLGDTFARTYA